MSRQSDSSVDIAVRNQLICKLNNAKDTTMVYKTDDPCKWVRFSGNFEIAISITFGVNYSVMILSDISSIMILGGEPLQELTFTSCFE